MVETRSEHALIRVMVADAETLFREALSLALQVSEAFDLAAEAATGSEAVAEAERTKPDIALLTSNIAHCDVTRAVRLITERVPECRIAVLSEGPDTELLAETIEAGAKGFFTKDSSLPDLIDSLQSVHRGDLRVPQEMLAPLMTALVRGRRLHQEAMGRIARLTPREREVLRLLSGGADNEAIAYALVISPQTARTHIQNVLAKLGLHSRLEAVAFVLQNGILDLLVDESSQISRSRGPRALDRAGESRN